MDLIYIAGKFRGGNHWEIHQNVTHAEEAIPKLIGMGYAPICPHKMTENLQGLFSDKRYLDICIELLARCDAIYMLKGWEASRGATIELELAESLDLEVLYE